MSMAARLSAAPQPARPAQRVTRVVEAPRPASSHADQRARAAAGWRPTAAPAALQLVGDRDCRCQRSSWSSAHSSDAQRAGRASSVFAPATASCSRRRRRPRTACAAACRTWSAIDFSTARPRGAQRSAPTAPRRLSSSPFGRPGRPARCSAMQCLLDQHGVGCRRRAAAARAAGDGSKAPAPRRSAAGSMRSSSETRSSGLRRCAVEHRGDDLDERQQAAERADGIAGQRRADSPSRRGSSWCSRMARPTSRRIRVEALRSASSRSADGRTAGAARRRCRRVPASSSSGSMCSMPRSCSSPAPAAIVHVVDRTRRPRAPGARTAAPIAGCARTVSRPGLARQRQLERDRPRQRDGLRSASSSMLRTRPGGAISAKKRQRGQQRLDSLGTQRLAGHGSARCSTHSSSGARRRWRNQLVVQAAVDAHAAFEQLDAVLVEDRTRGHHRSAAGPWR